MNGHASPPADTATGDGRARLVVDPRPLPGDAAFVVWQLLDSNLPTGGFAHSFGLEAALQLGQFGLAAPNDEAARVEGLMRYCRQLVRQQALLLLHLVRAGFHSAAAGALGDPSAEEEGAAWWRGVPGRDGEHPTLARWAQLDGQCHALITTEGGRRASIAQGQALLRLACEAFPTLLPHHKELLRAARDRIRWAGCKRHAHHPPHTPTKPTTIEDDDKPNATDSGSSSSNSSSSSSSSSVSPLPPVHGHHAPVFGWLCHALGVTAATADRMFLYLVLRDVLAAATRLGLVGPLLAVRLQMALHPDAERAAAHFAASEAANDGRRLVGGPQDGAYPAPPLGSAAAGASAAFGDGAANGSGGRAAFKYRYTGPPPPVQDNPMLDILQGAHERLYSRLFIS